MCPNCEKKFSFKKTFLTLGVLAISFYGLDTFAAGNHGKMDHSKSSADNFHFVITCRDDKRRSFNMIYDYAIDANAPVLVLEQQRPEPEPEVLEEEQAPRLTGNEAWALCIDMLQKKSKNMIDVLYMEENPNPALIGQEEYDFSIPLEAKNPSGNRLRYNGLCKVLADSTTTLKIVPRK